MGLARRSSSTLRLLIVDRRHDDRQALRVALETRIPRPLAIHECDDDRQADSLIGERRFDAIAADIDSIAGARTIAGWSEASAAAAIFAMGPGRDVTRAVAAVQAGAADFLEKPIDAAALARRIERHFGAAAIDTEDAADGLDAQSPAMQRLMEQIGRVAPSPAPIFVTGEPASGKGRIARAVHDRSRRRTGPFVAADCRSGDGASLLALLAAPGGAIDRADGGTLFLDEIDGLPDTVQSMLLRFLEAGEIGGLGDRRKVSARVISASSRPLGDLIGGGGLRPDLFFRLNVLTLAAPPLRDRGEDLPALTEDFIGRAARAAGQVRPRLSGAARAMLAEHDWPGNFRDLRAVAERIVAAATGGLVTEEAVAGAIVRMPGAADQPSEDGPAVLPLRVQEELIIEAAIARFRGNIAKAAAALEISPSTIYRRRRPREDDALEGAGAYM